MIHVSIEKKYKSILENLYVSLPDFTIISGVNGAGKSHLLSAISEGVAVVNSDDKPIKTKKYFNSNSLAPADNYSVGRESFQHHAQNTHQQILNHLTKKKEQPALSFDVFYQNEPNLILLINKIAKDSGKEIDTLEISDITENLPLTVGINNDIFYQNFSSLFKRYYDRYDDNLYYEYLNQTKGKKIRTLSEAKFTKRYGTKPWELINEIFISAGIDYQVNDPMNDVREDNFHFKLVNKLNGANVNFSDLSSGEKVLMSLALALYNSKQLIAFPDLLLLDEPDAPLHPSMAKQLLQVLQDVFVKERKVKVILTTHSPSTVAMAPEESLFVMNKNAPRIEKRSKEQIMKLLTDGIPSFSVYADNRRQVFVESKTDADFYTKVYSRIKKRIKSDNSLYFIGSGAFKGNTGNCEQVKELVNLLTEAGNQTTYGIIDWDLKNNNEGKIFVLGQNQRYSIENYILDPLLLSNFLLREKMISRDYLELDEDDTSHDFANFSNEKLQQIVDKITGEVFEEIKKDYAEGENVAENLIAVQYLNGQSLYIPRWYLITNGHKLEEAICRKFPKLKGVKNLKEQITSKVIDDIPDFIPMDLLFLLQNLHN